MSLKNFTGVLVGDAVQELFEVAKKHQFALPAVNVIGTNSINAVMETAKAVKSPVIIQLSNGGAQFYAGKTLSNENQQACILGAVSAAEHVHLLAEHYGIAVILHTEPLLLNQSKKVVELSLSFQLKACQTNTL